MVHNIFSLPEITEGKLGTVKGIEYTDKNRNRRTYLPMWFEINQLLSVDVNPKEVATKIQSVFN
ncbi:hypothetical protein [Cytobacillus sp. IB215665]|uniref:hypothetical protein n=1 Tax=Cytobacillus sp. IB215665 TaxID=3097357 RepID=UPI002A0E29FA|nr:hypothetical protein [Cytobacillus sp. IB215665]MDX8366571.1 hypothetical protein [Cytobacillus sp. IB215665]